MPKIIIKNIEPTEALSNAMPMLNQKPTRESAPVVSSVGWNDGSQQLMANFARYTAMGYGILIEKRDGSFIPGYEDWQLEAALDRLERK
jgi:hypothetical protein